MKHFIPTILIFVCSISTLYAQKNSCKAKIKENRNKILIFENIHIDHIVFGAENGMEIHAYKDSLVVQKGLVRVNGFKIKNYQIVDTKFVEYYPDGKVKRFDSLSTTSKWKSTPYYGNYNGWMVHTHFYYPSGIPASSNYYWMSGRDSLEHHWYPNGVLQKTTYSYRSGEDSAVYKWNQEGILQSLKKPLAEYEYYPNGILKKSITDTVVNHYGLECIRTYYPRGTLRSVEYNYWGTPCLDWLYYTEQGTLEKTVKKGRAENLPSIGQEVMENMVDEVFTIVEQSPEFPGGEYNLAKYLNEKLSTVACESGLPIYGTYTVSFLLGRDGVSNFKELKGENKLAIEASIKQIINNMPKWKPGKQGGRAVSTIFELQLKLKEI